MQASISLLASCKNNFEILHQCKTKSYVFFKGISWTQVLSSCTVVRECSHSNLWRNFQKVTKPDIFHHENPELEIKRKKKMHFI